MFRSLRPRLTLIFVSLAVAPLVLIAVVTGLRTFTVLEQGALADQADAAHLAATGVQSFIEARELEMRQLNDIQGFSRLDAASQKELLEGLLFDGQWYSELVLLNDEGQVQTRLSRRTEAIPEQPITSYAGHEAFATPVSTGGTYFSPIYFDETTNEPLITISVPYTNLVTGRTGYVLLAQLRFRPIWDQFGSMNLRAEQEVFMLDEQGLVVAHNNPSVVLRQTTFDLPEGSGRAAGLSGSEVIYATEEIQLANQKFTVVAEQSHREAAELAISGVRAAVLLAGITVVVAATLVFFVVRQITAPIELLSQTADRIRGGELSERVQISSQDEIGRLAESFNQMTEQLQETLESERMARLEAEEVTRLKDLFLATMSHELRTPLNAIIGFQGLMIFGGSLVEDDQHMAERSLSNAERLLSLINNILDLSRITSGRLEVTPAPMSPYALAETVREDMALQIKEKNLAFHVEVDSTLPETIVHDEERIFQIVTNLVGNAIKFTEEGEIRVTLGHNADKLIIKVSDTGIGIPPAKQHLIFDEFTQVDSSSTRKFGGAGLGLAIVKRLTVLMKGTVDVRSEIGEGSTFTVVLPLSLQAMPQATPPQVMPSLQPA